MNRARVSFGLAAAVGLLLVTGPAAQGLTSRGAHEAGRHRVSFSRQCDDSRWKAERFIDGPAGVGRSEPGCPAGDHRLPTRRVELLTK